MPRKATPVSLSDFHKEVPGGAPPEGETLPSGPTAGGNKDGVRRTWISEWDGQAEVLHADVLPASPGGTAVHTVEDFKTALDLLLREFLSNGDLIEAARCVIELGAPQFHYQLVKRGVTLAMEKAGRECEMTAVLLSSLHARGVLTSAQIAEGFRGLLEAMDDLVLDIPAAPGLVSHFLADAHLDGTLPLFAFDEFGAALASNKAAMSVLSEARNRLRGRVPLGGSQLDRGALRVQLRTIVAEYLVSHDEAEVGRRLSEMFVPPDLQHELVRASIELAMDRKDHERELVSQLLSSLYNTWLRPEDVSRGFEQLIARIDDLGIDNPRASELLAAFLTRAVADEILPPAFVLVAPPDALTSKAQREALKAARALLVASHFGERRRHVWGAAAVGTLDELKREVAMIVEEYAVSGETDEAVRCVRELDAPSYHHELIKRLVSSAVVDGGPRELELALTLTSRLADDALLTSAQLGRGCTRLVDAAPDLRLDHPRAPELLADYFERCCKLGLLTPQDEWHATASGLRAGKASNAASEIS